MSRPTLRSSLTSALRTFASSSRAQAGGAGASPRPLTDVLAPSSAASSSSASTTSTANPMDSPDYRRLMERSLSTQGEEERRKRFMTKTIIKPTELTTTALHARRPPRARTPLLGPRSSIAKAQDPFYITRTNPIDHALNPNFVLSFLNPLGRIKKRQETGLTRRTQRKVDKMVKRARGMGVIPVFTNVGSADGLGRRRL